MQFARDIRRDVRRRKKESRLMINDRLALMLIPFSDILKEKARGAKGGRKRERERDCPAGYKFRFLNG